MNMYIIKYSKTSKIDIFRVIQNVLQNVQKVIQNDTKYINNGELQKLER